jgi:hypothetical protein
VGRRLAISCVEDVKLLRPLAVANNIIVSTVQGSNGGNPWTRNRRQGVEQSSVEYSSQEEERDEGDGRRNDMWGVFHGQNESGANWVIGLRSYYTTKK